MSSSSSLAKAAVSLLSKFLIPSPETSAEEEVHENETASHGQKTLVLSNDVERALESIDITVPGAYPDEGEDDADLQYLQYLRAQKEEEDATRLERQTSKQLQEQLQRRREAAVKAKCRQTQEIKRIDDYLRELVVAEARGTNRMAGPAPTKQAYSSRSMFVKPRQGAEMDVYGSAPPKDGLMSYAYSGSCAYSGSTKKLSLYESAPGSRWPKRLSAERNSGFAGGGKSGLRRDAVNAVEERARKKGGASRIAVPTGLQEAMRRGHVIGIPGRKDEDVVPEEDQGRGVVLIGEDEWVTDEENEDAGVKTDGISNIRIKRRAAEKVDDLIVRQVGMKKWSLEEHMGKRQRQNKRRVSENLG